mgnify:CR=1 FL=1
MSNPLTDKKVEQLIELLNNLGWEYQRMSTDGQTILNTIYAMVGIEPMEDDRQLDIEYMMNKVEKRNK